VQFNYVPKHTANFHQLSMNAFKLSTLMKKFSQQKKGDVSRHPALGK